MKSHYFGEKQFGHLDEKSNINDHIHQQNTHLNIYLCPENCDALAISTAALSANVTQIEAETNKFDLD